MRKRTNRGEEAGYAGAMADVSLTILLARGS
jgi:hypothetical protein